MPYKISHIEESIEYVLYRGKIISFANIALVYPKMRNVLGVKLSLGTGCLATEYVRTPLGIVFTLAGL